MVLRRLQHTADEPDQSKSTDSSVRSWAVTERLITTATLNGMPSGKQQLLVEPQAVVTPAARDELRQRGIQMVRRDAKPSRAAAQPSRFLRMTASGSKDSELLASLKRQLATRGVAHCDRAAKSIVLSSNPARVVYDQITQGRSAVCISRLSDVTRFTAELSFDVFVLDTEHLNLMACVNAAAAISREVNQ